MRNKIKKDTIVGCKCKVCGRDATGIIRGAFTCPMCYKIIQSDNFRRFNKGEEIPSDLVVYKNCYRYRCTNTIRGSIEYVKKEDGVLELKKEYCSKKCEDLDKQMVSV